MQVTCSSLKYKFMEIANRAKDMVIAHQENYGFRPTVIKLTLEECDIIQKYVETYNPPFADASNHYTSWYEVEQEPKYWPKYFLFDLEVVKGS